MELSLQEEKYISRIRKAQKRHGWVKWLMLISGLTNITLGIVCFYMSKKAGTSLVSAFDTLSFGDDAVNSAIMFSCTFTFLCVGFVSLIFWSISCVSLCYTCFTWHGLHHRNLLLKLIDQQSKE